MMKNPLRTRAALALAGLLASVSLAACGGGDDDGSGATKITFGYTGDFNGASLLAVAEDQGLWKKAGLDAETKVFTDGPTQIQALGTNDLDFGYIGPGALWLPASGKAKVIAINGLGQADRIIAHPKSKITSLEDLKGKKVGVPAGTSGDMILGLALESVGLTKEDVKVIDMAPDVLVQAFSSGQVDAAGIWYPLIDAIKAKVPDLVELAENKDYDAKMRFPSSFVTGAEPDKKLTAKVISVLKAANDYRLDHLQETVTATAKMLKAEEAQVLADSQSAEMLSSAELVERTEDGTVAIWLEAMAAYFTEAGKLTDPLAAEDFYLGDLYGKTSAVK